MFALRMRCINSVLEGKLKEYSTENAGMLLIGYSQFLQNLAENTTSVLPPVISAALMEVAYEAILEQFIFVTLGLNLNPL